jgi:Uma2 family endonuclease
MNVSYQTAYAGIPDNDERQITGEELHAMGDIGPCELVEGEIVKMTPTGDRHGGVENSFAYSLTAFVRKHKLGYVRVGEVGIYTRRNPDSVRGADVVFISNERYLQKKSHSYLNVAPDLVVAVMSPDDRWSEVMKKLAEYFGIGVRLVWVADPDTESVYAYRSLTDVRHFSKDDTLPGDEILPGFSIRVSEVFAD